MIDLLRFQHATLPKLGPLEERPGTLTPGQSEASLTLWSSQDDRVEIGLWECTPGSFQVVLESGSEFCHILSGRVRLTQTGGDVAEFGPGDALMMPYGWTGTWDVLEHVRKIYVFDTSRAG